ncbi:MAG: bifunctional [glutamine synthetase] adenylyltransferase/[glutamine synthetase]-adenylyl-L-tyrosine phosphorylase [Acidimicrobiales bacterium]
MPALAIPAVAAAVERSADPQAAARAIERLTEVFPHAAEVLHKDAGVLAAVVAVASASSSMARLLVTDSTALEVLSQLDDRPELARDDAAALARWKQLEQLRIAARDLLGIDALEATGGALASLADEVLADALRLGGLDGRDLAVIGMGKLGGRELNYASDIDIVFVGEADPKKALAIARRSWRVDVDLRPEGRSGPITRSLDSYRAYWQRWAQTWEFQALIKARAVAGDRALGVEFMRAAAEAVWTRPFGADDLRQVRAMKARTEGEVIRKGMSARELKRGPGGIRDIEFAVQLLQLVHGRADSALRSPTTLSALAELASAGYVATADADALEQAYRFLRAAEHRLQLVEDQQVHALPTDTAGRTRLARVMGFRDDATSTATAHFEEELRRHQATVRSIHQRLFFRPLLEAFAQLPATQKVHTVEAAGPGLSGAAIAERLAAFGFSDAERTRQAVQELTRGFTRSSRLMQQLLPLLFEWLSDAPDPDLGLLGLRSLSSGQHRRDQLVVLFRESPEAARRLCLLLGTSPLFQRAFEHQPELLSDLAETNAFALKMPPRALAALAPASAPEPARHNLRVQAATSLSWRAGPDERRRGLERLVRTEWLRLAAGDVLGLRDISATERGLSALAEVVLETALDEIKPAIPFAVIAMGRFGGGELSYASDLDVLFVYDSDQTAIGEATATALMRYLNGDTPATRLWTTDADLRPEGRQGPLARSLAAYQRYTERWAKLWERQAMLRGRFVAGNPEVGRALEEIASPFVWQAALTDNDVREIRRMKARIERERIPAGEDPQFHLKLGRGSLSDVEWTVQLLQLQHHVRAEGTTAALDALAGAGALDAEDAEVMRAAYRFCEETRNRLYLVRGFPGDALPATGPVLTHLARSLGTTPTELREEYRRRTRRCRQVVERLFYGRTD